MVMCSPSNFSRSLFTIRNSKYSASPSLGESWVGWEVEHFSTERRESKKLLGKGYEIMRQRQVEHLDFQEVKVEVGTRRES